MMDSKSVEENAHNLMKEAFELISNANQTRENSLVKTKLEEAMMWNNKDRTNKGELTPNETHVS